MDKIISHKRVTENGTKSITACGKLIYGEIPEGKRMGITYLHAEHLWIRVNCPECLAERKSK